jgi:purine-cytosine permease-like protein
MKLNKTKGVIISAIGCTLALISIYRANFIVRYYDLISSIGYILGMFLIVLGASYFVKR